MNDCCWPNRQDKVSLCKALPVSGSQGFGGGSTEEGGGTEAADAGSSLDGSGSWPGPMATPDVPGGGGGG